jgi:hypothetical protein
MGMLSGWEFLEFMKGLVLDLENWIFLQNFHRLKSESTFVTLECNLDRLPLIHTFGTRVSQFRFPCATPTMTRHAPLFHSSLANTRLL